MKISILDFLKALPKEEYLPALTHLDFYYQDGRMKYKGLDLTDIELTTEGLSIEGNFNAETRFGFVSIGTDIPNLEKLLPSWKKTSIGTSGFYALYIDYSENYNKAI